MGKGSPAKSCSPAISWNFLRVGRMSEVWGQESWCQELVALDHRVDLSIPTMARSRLGRGDLSFSEWTDWELGWLKMFCFRVWDGEPGWLRWIFGAPEQWQGGCSDYRRDFELRYSYWLRLWWFFCSCSRYLIITCFGTGFGLGSGLEQPGWSGGKERGARDYPEGWVVRNWGRVVRVPWWTLWLRWPFQVPARHLVRCCPLPIKKISNYANLNLRNLYHVLIIIMETQVLWRVNRLHRRERWAIVLSNPSLQTWTVQMSVFR